MTDTLLTPLRSPQGSGFSGPSSSPTTASNLRPGVQLTAEVLAATAAGQATLKIAQQVLKVRTTTALAVGEQLNLQVTHAGRLLVLARREPAAGTSPRSVSDLSQAIVREQLPVQRDLSALLGTAGAMAQAPAPPGVAPQLAASARAFLGALPRRGDLTDPQALARIVRWAVSGGGGNLAGMLSQLLTQLPRAHARRAHGEADPRGEDRLPPLPGYRPVPQGRVGEPVATPSAQALGAQLLGVLARRELLAMSAMFPRREERAALALEIPVRTSAGECRAADVVAMRIAHELIATDEQGRRSPDPAAVLTGEASHRWRVELAFDLPGVGPLEAVVTLGEEDRVAVQFHAPEAAARTRLQSKLGGLDERLRARGLAVDSLLAGGGVAPAPAAGSAPFGPMVSERA